MHLQIELDFMRDHKHDVLAEKLGVTTEKAILLVLNFWAGVMEHARSGDLAEVPDESVVRWSGWRPKRRPASDLVGALQAAGWLSPAREVVGWKKRYAKMLAPRRGASNTRPDTETFSPTRARLNLEVDVDVEELHPLTPSSSEPNEPGLFPPPPEPPAPPEDLAGKWNELATEIGLPRVEIPLGKGPAKAAKSTAPGVLARWSEIADALRHPVNAWHVSSRAATFEWACQQRQPWLALIAKAKAPPSPLALGPPRVSPRQAAIDRETASVDWDALDRAREEREQHAATRGKP